MKKLLMGLAFAGISVASMAQNTETAVPEMKRCYKFILEQLVCSGKRSRYCFL